MSTQTPNLNLDLREASDIFNPLSTNSNFETLDSVITEIRKKGGVPTYTTTASANLLKLSENPVPNETLFKFVAAGDANTWSYQETVNNIVALDGKQKTVKAGKMYVAWVNAANAMVVIAWPDVVDAQTFDGKGPAEWASKAQLDDVNQTADNATTTAQAAAIVANNALEKAEAAGMKMDLLYSGSSAALAAGTIALEKDSSEYKIILIEVVSSANFGHSFSVVIPDGSTYALESAFVVGGNAVAATYRTIAFNGKNATVGNGIANEQSPGPTYAIPYRIWGIK